MPYKYTPEQRAYALKRIAQNEGNIVMTAVQTGIPERTLRDWHKAGLNVPSHRHYISYKSPDDHAAAAVSPESPPPEFSDALAAMEYMRAQILDGLMSSEDWSNNLAYMSPYQRSQIAIMLLDRLMKLDEHLKPYRPKAPTTYHVVDSEGEEPYGKPDFAKPIRNRRKF